MKEDEAVLTHLDYRRRRRRIEVVERFEAEVPLTTPQREGLDACLDPFLRYFEAGFELCRGESKGWKKPWIADGGRPCIGATSATFSA